MAGHLVTRCDSISVVNNLWNTRTYSNLNSRDGLYCKADKNDDNEGQQWNFQPPTNRGPIDRFAMVIYQQNNGISTLNGVQYRIVTANVTTAYQTINVAVGFAEYTLNFDIGQNINDLSTFVVEVLSPSVGSFDTLEIDELYVNVHQYGQAAGIV